MTAHLRVLRPAPNIYAFYDGRVEGYRFAEGENWVDDGALSLGIASYAIVDGEDALIYDTHISVEYAAFIRKTLAEARREEFHGGAQPLASRSCGGNRCLCRLHDHFKQAHPGSSHSSAKPQSKAARLPGHQSIKPLILPTQTFEGRMQLQVGEPHHRPDRSKHSQR